MKLKTFTDKDFNFFLHMLYKEADGIDREINDLSQLLDKEVQWLSLFIVYDISGLIVKETFITNDYLFIITNDPKDDTETYITCYAAELEDEDSEDIVTVIREISSAGSIEMGNNDWDNIYTKLGILPKKEGWPIYKIRDKLWKISNTMYGVKYKIMKLGWLKKKMDKEGDSTDQR